MDMSFEELYALTLLIEGRDTRTRWPLFAKILRLLPPVDFALSEREDGTFLATKGDLALVLDPALPDGIADLDDVLAGAGAAA